MTEIQTHHSTTFLYSCQGHSQSSIHTGTRYGGTGRRFLKVDEDEIYTGEFVDKTPYDALGNPSQNPMIEFLKRKSKDTYVFLKDYKPKIKKVDSDIFHLEKNVKSLNEKMKYRDIKWKTEKENYIKEIDVVNGVVNDLKYENEEKNEKIEKLEKENEEQNEIIVKLQSVVSGLEKKFSDEIEKLNRQVYDLENPPLIPELRNPFDIYYLKY